MKSIFKLILCLISAILLMGTAQAADRANEEAGYFENTRTVLLLDTAYPKGDEWAARTLNRSMSTIFRYPYYRKLDTSAYSGQMMGASDMQAAAVEAGADIAVLPVVVQFDQIRRYPPFFFDADPIITTSARIQITYWEEEMDAPRTIETRFFDSQPEGPDTDPDNILDDMWKRLMKKFPYRRVPTDRSTNLSGAVVEQKN